MSAVGGIVADLIGLNGTRVVSQLPASVLFVGNSPSTPLMTIGTQSGFNASILSQLGGGLSSAAFRVSLFDGDNAPGDFDFNDNFFRVNGAEIQNFSTVNTVQTTGAGTPIGAASLGFNDEQLRTGFFFTNNAALLGTIYTGLGGGSLLYQLRDVDPGDQFYDFTQGIDAGLINVGTPPVVQPPGTTVPEPATLALVASGLLALGGLARRRTAA